MYFFARFLVLLMMFAMFPLGSYADDHFKLNGSARIRGEMNDNKLDFDKKVNDKRMFLLNRIRLNFTFMPHKNIDVFVQPQFSKTFGARDTTGALSSGAANDTQMDVHQGYVDYRFHPKFKARAGRTELLYGDQVLVSPLGWSNVGRSFDAVTATWNYGSKAWVEGFYSKIDEVNSATGSPNGDQDFYGGYNHWDFGGAFKNVDLYYFYIKDHTSKPSPRDHGSAGLRMKSDIGRFDYRAEGTSQNGWRAGARQADWMGDIELGYMLFPSSKTRFLVEASMASAHFDELFPLGHAYLGVADVLSRRNIVQYHAGLWTNLGSKLRAGLDYHYFERFTANTGAFNTSGASYGNLKDAKGVGQEIDLQFKYPINGKMDLSGGYSVFLPGTYIKDQAFTNSASTSFNSEDMAHFGFLQVNTKF